MSDLSIRDLLVRVTELQPAERRDAEWVMNRGTFDELARLTHSPGPSPGLPAYLIGMPVRIDEAVQEVELRVVR
jgi:HK97 family phage major capsid protein